MYWSVSAAVKKMVKKKKIALNWFFQLYSFFSQSLLSTAVRTGFQNPIHFSLKNKLQNS